MSVDLDPQTQAMIDKGNWLTLTWDPDVSDDPNLSQQPPKNNTYIGYGERLNSPTFTYQGNTARLKGNYLCHWKDRWFFMRRMVGFSQAAFTFPNMPYHVKRQTPFGYQHRQRPFNTSGPGTQPVLYPTGIDTCQGIGPRFRKGSEKSPTTTDRMYGMAEISVTYEPVSYTIKEDSECIQTDVVTDKKFVCDYGPPDGSTVNAKDYKNYRPLRYITKIPQPVNEILALPTGFYRWVEAHGTEPSGAKGTVSNVSYRRVQSYVDLVYRWHAVPAVPRVNSSGFVANSFEDHIDISGPAQLYQGCVNAVEFDGYAAGTLLLTGVEVNPYRILTGDRVYDYSYKMRYFEPIEGRGHNDFLRYTNAVNKQSQVVPTYHKLTVTGEANGATLYRRRPFHELFLLQDAATAKRRLNDYYKPQLQLIEDY